MTQKELSKSTKYLQQVAISQALTHLNLIEERPNRMDKSLFLFEGYILIKIEPEFVPKLLFQHFKSKTFSSNNLIV